MSSSDLDFAPDEAQDSSTDQDYHLPPPSRAVSTPSSPRKRRRSESGDWIRQRKYHLEGKYSDPYRSLFNNDVNAAASRFVIDDSLHLEDGQFGAVKWSAKEKNMFFVALERLGKDDLPGISAAIGTKTIQETRQFLLAIQEAPSKRIAIRGDSRLKIAMQDVPAAIEISRDCEDSLELAGDALAWYQERFEAKQEQAQFGEHWLITSELAEEIEKVIHPAHIQDPVSSPGLPGTDNDRPADAGVEIVSHPLLEDIPEAELLKPTEFLNLSRRFFMNPSPNVSYPWPHWTQLISEIAQEPSIYRTAFNDIHSLTVSLTRRIVQTAITQATARIRSQGWRVKKGVKPFVKPRDIHTAVDLLGLTRNGYKRWAGVARRCGLQVTDRDRDAHDASQRRIVPWYETEELLGLEEFNPESLSTDAETTGFTSGTDREDFRSKAMRSGTPIPTTRQASSGDSDEETDVESDRRSENEDSHLDSDHPPSYNGDSDASNLAVPVENELPRDKYEEELNAVETFDQNISLQGEKQLWNILNTSRDFKEESPSVKSETDDRDFNSARTKLALETEDWRDWTRYRAEWEALLQPIPHSKFIAGQKRNHDAISKIGDQYNTSESDEPSGKRKNNRSRREVTTNVDIPIRGAREYAEIQDRADVPRDHSAMLDYSSDEPDIPAPSIETAGGTHNSDDSMVLDDEEY
ncbi:hypothetical protein DM02DRAFT_631401 [Periconia macrospinosa]|uniref:Myb-like domain-containing protein n=1 Tax=Periconia macrospinosa TaxID=97972 RepID=A0A2V1DG98_9PLEO|nr:hypothetical protein DM02DRAFT_631401 [Periconia macrospinosa]